jgi:hypothetical protein
LTLFRHESNGFITADLDFRKKVVTVEGYKNEVEDLSPDILQTSEESLLTCMQTVVDQEVVDGFTLGDPHLLLRDLKVYMVEPSEDFTILFKEVDPAENETPGKFFRNVWGCRCGIGQKVLRVRIKLHKQLYHAHEQRCYDKRL